MTLSNGKILELEKLLFIEQDQIKKEYFSGLYAQLMNVIYQKETAGIINELENYITHPPSNSFLVNYSDYGVLNKLKNINGSRICELAILNKLSELGFDINKLSIKYFLDEHKKMWKEVTDCLEQNENHSEFFKYFQEFITQFSPHDNKYNLKNVNHISHYIQTVLELLHIVNTAETLNIVELGSNHGILSKTLQLLGHNILCTDLHHGIITNSINAYKVGTWIRENFIGINVVDTFKFNEDNINNLSIFDNGIDAIIMRGTGILSITKKTNNKNIILRVINKIKTKIFSKLTEELRKKDELNNHFVCCKNNIIELLKIINKNGLILAKNENIFSAYDLEMRINLLNKLSKEMMGICSISYKIEETKYSNPGWETFNITLICWKNKYQK
jgi:hypothetical protein